MRVEKKKFRVRFRPGNVITYTKANGTGKKAQVSSMSVKILARDGDDLELSFGNGTCQMAVKEFKTILREPGVVVTGVTV